MKAHIEDIPRSMLAYRIDNVGEKARVRVRAGRLGFDKVYGAKEEEFDDIVRFLDENEGIVIRDVKPDEEFFM